MIQWNNIYGKIGFVGHHFRAIKRILPSFLFNVLLPTLDVYSDLSLIIPWYLANHWKYALSMTLPLVLQFASTIYKWFQFECPKQKRWTWILLLLQLWPQWRAIRVLKLLYKNDKRHQKQQIELLRGIGSSEAFLEAAPSIIIMTIIWVSLGDGVYIANSLECGNERMCTSLNRSCEKKKNACAVFGGFGGVEWFFMTYAISVFTGGLGITKFLQIGPCSVLTEEGPLGGILTGGFILTYLAVMFSLLTKGLFIAIFVHSLQWNFSFSFFGYSYGQSFPFVFSFILMMLFLFTLMPNILMSFFVILNVSGCNFKKFIKVIVGYPSVWLLPTVTYFAVGPKMSSRCCPRKTFKHEESELGLSKFYTVANLLLTIISYGVMVTLFLVIPKRMEELYWVWHFTPCFVPVLCFGIIFTISFLFLDKKCCHQSHKCCCLRFYELRYQYINLNEENNQVGICQLS